MKRWLMIIGLWQLLETQAEAAPKVAGPPAVVRPQPIHSRSPNLRLVDEPISGPSSIQHAGMIANTDVAPNAILGVGVLKGAPKSFGSGEMRADGRTRSS